MIYVYTTSSCSGCKKAKEWLDNMGLKYIEKNIFQQKLTKDDILFILENTIDGFEDIISKRSKIMVENNIDYNEMKFTELIDFIIENPSVLRRPIIVSNDRMQVGYNEEEIGIFVPREIRLCHTCNTKGRDQCFEHSLNRNLIRLKSEELTSEDTI